MVLKKKRIAMARARIAQERDILDYAESILTYFESNQSNELLRSECEKIVKKFLFQDILNRSPM